METNVLERTVGAVLGQVISSSDEPLVVNPSEETLEELIEVLDEDVDEPSVRVLASERVLKGVMDDFLVASVAADLVAEMELDLRTVEGTGNTLVVTDSSVVAIVEAGDRVAGLATDDEEFVESAVGHFSSRWADAEEFRLRTPAITRVRESLEEDIGPDVAADFDDVLASLETARGDGNGLDEVTVSLLVAAKNEALLYDISKWGEDIGIASKATFSRTKTRLEDLGLLDTEKVPIDIGRPRLRLMLGDDRLRQAQVAELASTAQSIMANHGS